jgi:hypothetical protein
MALYRLHILKQPADPITEAGLLSTGKNVCDPILDMWSNYTIPVYYFSRIFSITIDWDFWRNRDPYSPRMLWSGSLMDLGLTQGRSGIFGLRPNRSFSFPLGKFATVFQTEIYAIIQYVCVNIRRAYKNKWILIFCDSQAALNALSSPKVTSALVAERLDAPSALASLNEVTLVWVSGHRGILGNEEADKLARQASSMPLLGPKPAVGIPSCSAREAIKIWTEYQHHSAWRDLPGQRHGKLFRGKPCKKRADDLLKLSRHKLKMVVAILTGHAPVRGHLYTMVLFDGDPTCSFCRKETETVQHIICCCEALAHQCYNIFGNPFVEPKDMSTVSVRDLCLFIRGTGVLNLC